MGGGGGRKVPALITTIEIFLCVFLYIHGKTTKSSDFSPYLLENKVMEIFLSIVSLVAMATQF